MQIPDWMPDELAYAGEEHLDTDYVATYDAKAQFDPTEDVDLLRDLGLNEESVVVDLGAGTGTFALAIAPYCKRVVAVDVSPAMVSQLREKAAESGLDNVDVVHGGFLSYEHTGPPADFVYSRNVLHHLPEFWKVIALQRTVGFMKPAGVFRLHDLVYSFDPADAAETIEAWLGGAAPSPELGWTREELATHVREEFSTFNWLLDAMLDRAGFDIREADHRPSKTYSAYTCVKR